MRLGKLVIMTDTEHFCLMSQLDMAKGYRAIAVADLLIAESAKDEAVAVARRFHAAGGYSHRLPAVKEQLAHATESLAHCIDLLVKWRPLVASLETTPGQFVNPQFDTQVSVTRELCGIDTEWKKSGEEWKKSYGYMTREEYENMFQGRWAAAEKVQPMVELANGDLVLDNGVIIPAEKRSRTEVYSRVVGYLRPVAQWNKGKKAEWADRKDFTSPKGEAIAQHQQ
jgi:hypothetical protein